MAYKYRCRECGCRLDPDEVPVCDECAERIRLWREQRKMVFGTPKPKMLCKENLRTGA